MFHMLLNSLGKDYDVIDVDIAEIIHSVAERSAGNPKGHEPELEQTGMQSSLVTPFLYKSPF